MPRQYLSSFVAEAARSLGHIPGAELCLNELSFDKNFSVQLCSRSSVPSFSPYMQFFIFLAHTLLRTQAITRHPKFTEYLKEGRKTKLMFFLSHSSDKEKTTGETHTEDKEEEIRQREDFQDCEFPCLLWRQVTFCQKHPVICFTE